MCVLVVVVVVVVVSQRGVLWVRNPGAPAKVVTVNESLLWLVWGGEAYGGLSRLARKATVDRPQGAGKQGVDNVTYIFYCLPPPPRKHTPRRHCGNLSLLLALLFAQGRDHRNSCCRTKEALGYPLALS